MNDLFSISFSEMIRLIIMSTVYQLLVSELRVIFEEILMRVDTVNFMMHRFQRLL